MICLSSLVAVRPRLSWRTSGLNQTCSFRWKNNFPASLTMRGNVTRPTHHQDAKNLRVSHLVKVEGSRGFDVEKILAISFGCSFEELSVIVLSTGPFPLETTENGSRAINEYDPLRELNGDTWKSFAHVFLNLPEVACSSIPPYWMPSGPEFFKKYIRLSSNVLLTSRIMAFSNRTSS